MYTYQQRLAYAKRLQRLQQAVVIKDNIHLTYKYKNRNKAYANIESVQDRINKAIIEDAVNGNAESIKNLETQGEQLIHDTLTNERKRLHQDKKHKAVNQATKSNSQYFTNIFNYRRKKIGESLEDKIEKELRKNKYVDLSDKDKIQELNKNLGDYGKKRLKNIITDAMHTNESNIGFIKAIEDGFNYKVWKNGRVAKGRTRAWHKEKIIQAVPIDETFDIYGSYPAHMMYPGDLNGGAENVANCRCWLLYTNNIPSNLRKKTAFNVSPTFQQIWEKARNPVSKLKTTIKKPIQKLKQFSHKMNNNIKSKLEFLNNSSGFSSSDSPKKNINDDGKPLISISKNNFSMEVNGFVDSKDIPKIYRQLHTLNNRIKNKNLEHGNVRRKDGKLSKLNRSKIKNKVLLSSRLKRLGKRVGLHTAIHNHPIGESPLASPEDIGTYSKYKIKYGISANDFGIFIVKNNNPGGNMKKSKKIEKHVEKIRQRMKKDFHKTLSEEGIDDWKKYKEENKEEYNERLHDHVNHNNNKYVERYQECLNKCGMEVKFIKL